VAIHVDAADALGGIRDYTRYLTTRDDRAAAAAPASPARRQT